MDERRLDRIETKLNELTKVVTDLAQIKERMVTLFKRRDTYDTKFLGGFLLPRPPEDVGPHGRAIFAHVQGTGPVAPYIQLQDPLPE